VCVTPLIWACGSCCSHLCSAAVGDLVDDEQLEEMGAAAMYEDFFGPRLGECARWLLVLALLPSCVITVYVAVHTSCASVCRQQVYGEPAKWRGRKGKGIRWSGHRWHWQQRR
jgi:hypothetical protein